jgi:vacuolar-type H+-ATPase subunit I/STV1
MGQIHYSFDPTRGKYELRDLFDLLHRYYPEIPADPNKIGSNPNGDSEKDRTIRELNEEIKRHVKENASNTEKINRLEQEFNEAKEYAKLAEEESQKKAKRIEQLTEEHAQKYAELRRDSQEEINKIKEEKDKQISSLNKQVDDLLKKISVYEPSFAGDVSSYKFFNIEGPILSETMADDAPFIGKVDIDGNAIFQFNAEKGPHKYFSQNISKLENFCDVIDNIDGANHIGLDAWGKGKFLNGTLAIIEKSKIKLTRE